MSLTRPQVRALLYPQVPGLGLVSTADTIQAGSVTDAYTLQDSNRGPNKWRGTYIYRPAATDVRDLVRKAGTLVGAILNQTGAPYIDQTTRAYEIVGLLHPDEFNACITRALQRVLLETQVCYSMYTGGNMLAATAAAFTPQDTGGVSSMGTTPDVGNYNLIFSGGAGQNSYTETPVAIVAPGDQLYSASISRLAAAATTLQFRLWDKTNNVEIGASMSHSQQEWTHLHRVDTVPATCYKVALRLQVNQANAVAHWDCLPAHNLGDYRLPVQGTLDEKYKLASFGEAYYRSSTVAPNATQQGQESAASRQWDHWVTPRDYALEVFRQDAVPNRLIITRKQSFLIPTFGQYRSVAQPGPPKADLWFHVQQPYTDPASYVNETDTTNAPQFQLLEAVMYEMALVLKERYPDEARWQRWIVEKAGTKEAERESRPVTPEQRQRHNYGGRV